MDSNRNSGLNLRNLALFNFSETNADGNMNHILFKSEIDYLQGRNEELRVQLAEAKSQSSKLEILLHKSEEEVKYLDMMTKYPKRYFWASLNKVAKMNKKVQHQKTHTDVFQPIDKLPTGLSPSSKDIISNLNEYLIDTLQVSFNAMMPCFGFEFIRFSCRSLTNTSESTRLWKTIWTSWRGNTRFKDTSCPCCTKSIQTKPTRTRKKSRSWWVK